MNPIYNEYIEFLKDKGIDIGLMEGYYWLDRQIVKAYDKQGNIHKIARIYTDDNLSVTYKTYNNKPFDIASWGDIVTMNADRLAVLEKNATKLISDSFSKYGEHNPVVLTSGGKDSSVTMHLVRQVSDSVLGVFNNTSLDCSDTYLHIKSLDNIHTINPKEGFYQWRYRLQMVPNRVSRACCTEFKEGEFVKQWDKHSKTLLFLGMRNQESATRSGYGDEWRNEKWGDNWQGVLPIREWTEVDVWLYIFMRDIPINKKYKKGYARVGCAVACPYYTKSTWVLDKHWYPSLYDRWHKILDDDFVRNNKWLIMNCTKNEYHSCWNGGSYRVDPTEEVINEYANHSGLSYDIAANYFGHICSECSKPKKIKSKDVLAMNMKFIGRSGKYLCKKHLKEYLNIDEQQWNQYIEDFKSQGCQLF